MDASAAEPSNDSGSTLVVDPSHDEFALRTPSRIDADRERFAAGVAVCDAELERFAAQRPDRERWRIVLLTDAQRMPPVVPADRSGEGRAGAGSFRPWWRFSLGVWPVSFVEYAYERAKVHTDPRLRRSAYVLNPEWLSFDGYRAARSDDIDFWLLDDPLPAIVVFPPDDPDES